MARRKTTATNEAQHLAQENASSVPGRTSPLVFISHDSRDADLAEAFDNLLTDASGGVVQTFRSSDQTGRAGIDYGENWYSKIAESLSVATDVVALLTPNSIDRPWILFEAGFAVGRLDTKVFGIALGIPLSKAVSGPFAQFQNCEANEQSLSTVVLKLIQRNPTARPREQAVRRQVKAFLEDIIPLLNERPAGEDQTQEELDATAVAKVFEEVKVMFRDLPSRVEHELRGSSKRHARFRMHPGMIEEVFFMTRHEDVSRSLPWLVLASMLRDDAPWIAEAAIEVSRALENGSKKFVDSAQKNLIAVVRMTSRNKLLSRYASSDETAMMLRHLPDMIEHFVHLTPLEEQKARRKGAEGATQSDDDSAA